MSVESLAHLKSRRSFIAALGGFTTGVALPLRSVIAEERKTLRLFIWDTYVGTHTLADFKDATGIEVTMETYADDDELLVRLKEDGANFDVVVPTNDILERLVEAGMLQTLDHSKIPNMSNIDRPFRDAVFDRHRKYSIPYMWGTVGIGYRISKVGQEAESWKVIYDSDKFAGLISLQDDPMNVLGCGLKYLGYSFNSTDPEELQQVEDMLIGQKKNIKIFAPTEGEDLLLSGEVDVCLEWNGDIAQIIDGNNDIGFSVPKEGSLLWQDVMAIPAAAPNPANAHAFLNYVLDAQAGKHIAETVRFATCNAAARELMDSTYVNNPAIFPPAELVAKCEPSRFLGDEGTKLRQEVWARIKAA